MEKLARESKLKSLLSCTLTKRKPIKIIHCSARFSAYIMAEQGEKQYSLLRTLGMEILYLFGNALFELNGSFTPRSIMFRILLTCKIHRHWDELGFNTPCPIHFTEEELQAHYRDGEGWNERADFWDSLAGFVSRDGWTSNETYDQALEMFAELREEGLKNLTGKERVDFEAQTRWAERKVNSVC